MHDTAILPSEELADVEQARADFYAVLAACLLAPPSAALLQQIGEARFLVEAHSDTRRAPAPLAVSWTRLSHAASVIDPAAVNEEFHSLFVSTGTSAVNPWASFYLSGFLMNKPLAALRADLGQLGLARAKGVFETEDHLGALLETMRVLIQRGENLATQQHFFATHIGPWYARCLHDLRALAQTNFYRLLADFLDTFLELEAQAFEMAHEAPLQPSGVHDEQANRQAG